MQKFLVPRAPFGPQAVTEPSAFDMKIARRNRALAAVSMKYGVPHVTADPVGRKPTALKNARMAQRVVADAFAESESENFEEWLVTYGATPTGTAELAVLALLHPAGGAAGSAADDGQYDDGAAAVVKAARPDSYRTFQSPVSKAVLRAAFHRWGVDGTHVAWREVKEWQLKVKDVLGLDRDVPSSTAYDYRKKEMDAYARGGGIRVRPNIARLLDSVKLQKMLAEQLKEPPPESALFKDGTTRPFTYPKKLYPELGKRCMRVKDWAGFGPSSVAALAKGLLQRVADDDGKELDWQPSPEWCACFIHQFLHLRLRRITTAGGRPEPSPKQLELHQKNLMEVSYLRHCGVPRSCFMQSDETGVPVFPSTNYKWEVVGTKIVAGIGYGDKRQFTADIGTYASRITSRHGRLL